MPLTPVAGVAPPGSPSAQPWPEPMVLPVPLPQPETTDPVCRLSPYTEPCRSPTSTAWVPPSSNSTGEASAMPHGASLRMVPAVAVFHVSASVTVGAAAASGTASAQAARPVPPAQTTASARRVRVRAFVTS